MQVDHKGGTHYGRPRGASFTKIVPPPAFI
jgi:hypothetical protein